MARTAKQLPQEEEETTLPAKPAVSKSKLSALLIGGKQHEETELSTVQQKSYINIVSDPESPMLDPTKPEYIKGAKYGSFVIPSKKISLGTAPLLTVLGMFKVYEETEAKKEGDKSLPKILSYWMPEDAEQIPVDGMFDRPFINRKDGLMHVLRPVHWVVVRLDKYPEIDDAVITFRSTGNSVYQQLVKLIKTAGVAAAPQLKIKLKVQKIENKNWNKTNLYPDFEIAGMNFDVDKSGTPVLIDDGFDEETLVEVLTSYNDLAQEYIKNNMVSKKGNISALIGPPSAPKTAAATLAKPAGKPKYKQEEVDDNEEDQDEDGEEVTF